ncbi:MAG: AAA family ATPase [Deltaproteobacteria bacterium]|nr:AAA family ATPase [Deltaproteobacteria bacterium]
MEKAKDEETVKVKRLCVTDRPFTQIIQRNYLYVDKTKFIYDILNGYGYQSCFLSRPRRFGKTLLLDTMSELFQGNRDLFKGLWIDKSDYQFEKHPVLFLDMSYDDISSSEDLKNNIKDDLEEFADEHDIKLAKKSCGRMLKQLLKKLYKKNKVGTVILVDEYDSPVTRYLSNLDLAIDNRQVLHDFYLSMKKNNRYVHFAFVTGISRFGLTSLDSGANNFKDISLMPEFAAICGFTSDELISFFSNRFTDTLTNLKSNKSIAWNAGHKALMAKIHQWYDGYNWLGPDHVYNPFSIINFFDEKNNFARFGPCQVSRPICLLL